MVGDVARWLVLSLVMAGAAGGVWYARERRLRRTHAMPGGLRSDITLPHTAEFELYHNDFSLCSKKIRMCLAELGIPYVGHHVDLIETGSYETLGRRFLAVNPAGLVPVLVHQGHPVYESHDILLYAAAHARTADRLVPDDPDARASMQRWVDRSSLVGDDPTRALAASAGNCVPGLTIPLFAAMIRDIPTWRIAEGLLFHRLKVRPALFLLLKGVGLSRVAGVPPVRRVVVASRREMARHLDDLERQLAASGGPWILGSAFSLADVSWAVIFERLREADWLDELVPPSRGRVAAYWAVLRQRPTWDVAMTRHEHPLVREGTRRIAVEKRRVGGALGALYAAS
jgi:glutathione S-transferase